MPSVSNIAVGALVAGSAASKARRGTARVTSSFINETTILTYGGDAAGQSSISSYYKRGQRVRAASAARNAGRWYFSSTICRVSIIRRLHH